MDLTAAASPSLPRPTPPSTTRNNEARDAIEVDRIYLRNNLRLYIREAWHVVEPSTVYLENWHIDLIAEYLEAVTAGQIKRLLINMPPRYAKSTCVSIMWPPWVVGAGAVLRQAAQSGTRGAGHQVGVRILR